jgi:hypothetical protein
MKLLAQKSLKTELRLKRYVVLKLQGLDCKTAETRFKLKSELRTRLELEHNSGASV